MNHVTGIVQAVGEKFNGSLKVNDVWYSFAKGKKTDVEKGVVVTLTLKEWAMGDKKGLNIVDVVAEKEQPKAKEEPKTIAKASALELEYKPRDFDNENRGKVRHGLLVAALPLILQELVTVEKAKEVIESLVPFVMGK